jgi:hypothetical protein
MRKKMVKRRWPYFFGQRSHGSKSGNMPELIKHPSEWPNAESLIEDILRWADDGGKMLDLENYTTPSDLDDTWKRRSKR